MLWLRESSEAVWLPHSQPSPVWVPHLVRSLSPACVLSLTHTPSLSLLSLTHQHTHIQHTHIHIHVHVHILMYIHIHIRVCVRVCVCVFNRDRSCGPPERPDRFSVWDFFCFF